MTKGLSLHMFAIPALLAMLAGLFVYPDPSWAIGLQDAKTQGLVGEQPDGYLGAVKPNPSAEIKALIADINAKRKKEYQSIAQRNNTNLDLIEALAGKKAIERTAPGQYVKMPSGAWTRK